MPPPPVGGPATSWPAHSNSWAKRQEASPSASTTTNTQQYPHTAKCHACTPLGTGMRPPDHLLKLRCFPRSPQTIRKSHKTWSHT